MAPERICQRDRRQSIRRVERLHHDRAALPQDEKPESFGEYKPEADDLTCAGDGKELAGYLEKHPNRGMPFGFPPPKQEEFDIVAGWLVQGARGPDAAQQSGWPNTASTGPKTDSGTRMTGFKSALTRMILWMGDCSI